MGVVSLPSERSARSQTSPGRVSERQTLPLLGLGRRHSRRTQRAFGTAMRLCVSLFRRRRGPAGLRDFFRFCRNRDLYIRRSWFSACARQGRYHYPRCAPRAAETLGGRLSKRLICRFLRSGGRSSPHDSYFLANTQNFLLAVPVANAFALWYDKFSKLEVVEEERYERAKAVEFSCNCRCWAPCTGMSCGKGKRRQCGQMLYNFRCTCVYCKYGRKQPHM